MNDLLIKQLEALSPSEQRLVLQFIEKLRTDREKPTKSKVERKRTLKLSFGTIDKNVIIPSDSLRREHLYGEEGR